MVTHLLVVDGPPRDPNFLAPDPSWGTVESIPLVQKKKVRNKAASRKRKAGAEEAGDSANKRQRTESACIAENLDNVAALLEQQPAPHQPVPASPAPSVGELAAGGDDSSKTFAELRSSSLAATNDPPPQRVRALSTSSSASGQAQTAAVNPRIVIVATQTECPSCPKYHLYANDKKNLSRDQLQEAIAAAMHRVQALRARNAALPASTHAPNCPTAAAAARMLV